MCLVVVGPPVRVRPVWVGVRVVVGSDAWLERRRWVFCVPATDPVEAIPAGAVEGGRVTAQASRLPAAARSTSTRVIAAARRVARPAGGAMVSAGRRSVSSGSGVAVSGVSAPPSAASSSVPSAGRAAGSLRSVAAVSAVSAGGASGCSASTAGAGWPRCMSRSASASSATKGRVPVSIWKRITPNE